MRESIIATQSMFVGYFRGIVGIHVQYYAESGYWRKWKQFHGSPAVMTAYQFVSYINEILL